MMEIDELNAFPGGVAVLCGGPGGEREVSLASGDNACRGLERAGVACRKVVVPEERPEAFLEELECGLAVMMLHGRFGEDGTAQAILERRGVPFSGSSSASCRLSMDKNATKEGMLLHGVPTPRWTVTDSARKAVSAAREADLRYPLFVKPNDGGSSVGVGRVDRHEDLERVAASALAVDPLVVIEEMVEGRELTAGWLAGELLPIIELSADGVFYDYHAKYESEKTRYTCPARLDEDVERAIRRHCRTVIEFVGARDIARVDLMLGRDGPKVLELNALPGFTSHSLVPMAAKAAGIRFEQLCVSLVGMAAGRAGVSAK